MTDAQDTPGGAPRKTWQERNAEAKTKAAKDELAAEWQAADKQIQITLKSGSSGETRALELATKAIERWSHESRGIPAKKYAIWVRDAAGAEPITINDDEVSRATNTNDTPEAEMEARERAESLAADEPCHDIDTLKRLTHAVCARKFAALASIDWEELPGWARYTIDQCWLDDNQRVEKQAAKALEMLRDSIKALRAVPSEGGAVRATFARHLARDLRSEDVQAVVEYSAEDPLDINTMGIGAPKFRQKLAIFWTFARQYLRDKRDAIANPYPPEVEASRPLASADELAVVAILGGDWPDGMQHDWQKGVTARAVIDSVKGGFAAKDGALTRAKSVIAAGLAFGGMKLIED